MRAVPGGERFPAWRPKREGEGSYIPPVETERLYFSDPYLTTFDARVVKRGEIDGKPAVVLDRSAFYPEGGGQPADRGTLGGVAVVDVQVDESAEVWHLLSAPLPADTVAGAVDWTRRFDHMQQHHGQHLLSAAFENLFAMRTVSFHLGTESSTIDLASAAIAPDQLTAAADLTNRTIWEDHPVDARFVTPAELASLPLRKASVVQGPIRIVSAGHFDHSPCGGTHPRSTGAVGLLHIRRAEKRGGETRVEFVCGARALRDLRFNESLVTRMATTLTVGAHEVWGAVTRLREAEERSHKRLQALMEELSGFQADQLVANAARVGGAPVVRRTYADRTLTELRYLAAAIAVRGGLALLGLSGDKAQILFARPADSNVDCGKLLKETLAQFGGKGGGQPAIAQGGVPDSTKLDAALDAALQRLQSPA